MIHTRNYTIIFIILTLHLLRIFKIIVINDLVAITIIAKLWNLLLKLDLQMWNYFFSA